MNLAVQHVFVSHGIERDGVLELSNHPHHWIFNLPFGDGQITG